VVEWGRAVVDCVPAQLSRHLLELVRARRVVGGAVLYLRLPKPLSDQFPVRVCSCPLCI